VFKIRFEELLPQLVLEPFIEILYFRFELLTSKQFKVIMKVVSMEQSIMLSTKLSVELSVELKQN
jgi:hypothetical protein